MKLGTSAVDTHIASTTALTASANGSAQSVDTFRQLVAFLNVTAASGTTPTLDIKFQDAASSAGPWFDIPGAAFAQVTAVGAQRLAIPGPVGLFIRAVRTVAGTTPSFTATLQVVGTP